MLARSERSRRKGKAEPLGLVASAPFKLGKTVNILYENKKSSAKKRQRQQSFFCKACN